MKICIFILALIFSPQLVLLSQAQFDFYISNSGSNNNSGISPSSSRQTIIGSDSLFAKFAAKNGSVRIGLRSGDIFNEAFLPVYKIEMGTYYDIPGKNDFAILNGTDVFNDGWAKVDSTNNTFKHDINLTGFIGNGINTIGQYSFIYVIEIDTALEKISPVAARKPLIFMNTLAGADSIPGSFYEPNTTDPDSATVFVHTSNGQSPNSNARYRYEVTTRGRAVYDFRNSSDMSFQNLWVRGFGAGQGMLPGGINSSYDKMIFGPGAAIHHSYANSGTFNHILFLPGSDNTDDGAMVFYDTSGLHQHNKITNSIFLDIPTPVYSHTSGNASSTYGALEIDSTVDFTSPSIKGGTFITTLNTDSVILNNVYAEGNTIDYKNGSPGYLSINSCYFKDVDFAVLYSSTPVKSYISNTFLRSTYMGIKMDTNTSLELSNSIIHMNNPSGSNNMISTPAAPTDHIKATGNIFIEDADAYQPAVLATINTDSGIATSGDIWDNNVYIRTNKSNIYWLVTNPNTNNGSNVILSFDEWQRQSGQDKNSLYFDLSNDLRGLKAIFVDPDNGDYDLTNTPEADQIRAIHAGMTNPITCFLQKPTYDEATGMIMNSKAFNINSCKNPCLQGALRINYRFTPSVLNNKQVLLQWNDAAQPNIDHFEIEKATGNGPYSTITAVPVSADSIYSFKDNDIELNTVYHYRLAVIASNSDRCYSNTDSIVVTADKNHATVYPNPAINEFRISLPGYTGPVSYALNNDIRQKILTGKTTIQNGVSSLINITKEPPGFYFLEFQTNDGFYIDRLIIK